MSVHDPWCPNCGDEFQPHVSVCPDCAVRLRPGPRPEAADPVVANARRVAELVAIDLSDIDPSARRTLSLMLDAESIGHRVDGAVLSIPDTAEPRVTELLDSMGWSGDDGFETAAQDMVNGYDVDVGYTYDTAQTERRLPRTMADFPVAGPGQRLLGALADNAITRILVPIVGSFLLLPFSIDWNAARPAYFGAILAAQLIYEFVGTAVWGQTLGKKLVRSQVVTTDERALPGWGRAAIRSFTPVVATSAIGLAVAASSAVTDVRAAMLVVFFVGAVAPYLSVFWRADRRSLYDLAAGTVVINRSPDALVPVIRSNPLVTGR